VHDPFRGADFITDHYSYKSKRRLSVGKRTEKKFDVETFNLKKLNDVEVREILK